MKSLKLISSAITMLICFVSMAQERTIKGTVSDNSSVALPGVSVTIKKTKTGTSTDFDGKYSIRAQKGDILIFSYIGFNTETVVVNDKDLINVKMKEASQNLNEVVVVGYGTSNSEYTTQNYTRSERKKDKKSVTEMLQGRTSGLQVQTNTQYVAPSNIKIHGSQSLPSQNEPLYVLDGVPVKSQQIARINPNDIQDMKVLKETSATSIYGSRAANGAIIIATKNNIYKNLTEQEINKKLNITVPVQPEVTNEDYDTFTENAFESPKAAPLSTFSIDFDNASYTNIRRFINNGQAVPKDAVRVEEMINFFKYTYPQPKDKDPFSINTELSESPWNPENKILRIGLQGKNIPTENLPASNLVFLVDVSGSMNSTNKLPLLKQSMKILVNELRSKDKVAIVVYAGAAGLVLPPTSGDEKETIIKALDHLSAGGSTAGGAGIELAYKVAVENFIKGGNNRVVLATDGDFNVGSSSNADMETLIEQKRKTGVFLTCLGYGMGNYKDSKMETLADKGNGNYAYIDNIQEANRFLSKEFKGSMFAIAKDVKIQIEFNPKQVQAYRLIGYENRKLRAEDFKNDAIDAGELGSNHTVTALYEIIPAGVKSDYLNHQPDALKYTPVEENTTKYSTELATIKFRYKKPDGDKSIEMVAIIENKTISLESSSTDFKFSTAVAWFGLKLRDSKLITNKSSDAILKLAKQGVANDTDGYKAEFIRLIEGAKLAY
ncbi:von Willebrand factor type A domain-containing protein [Flavobacterium sp. Fl-318]|uniref:von Willebrand factor type A domain-containing protein n=1 Tax=Flavobacterium cupriresistens TaxID=2893885 RepID=A0ABU4REQ5_9FLAO|nr:MULTISPECIES: VWA domain-containing protein [unclassified Flavobacterium]MDX6191075.1 von Willebrand factor type A domain-containing protein [Flavobacterium sp. Fl-318]UFH42604.1 von Willebrand factor type A domain-containing protein [Flavobacterium sp. F-323]